MPTWDSDQYARFLAERTRPAEDLAARVDVVAPKRVVDLGCGPGNSTAVIARRWPDCERVGVDSSAAMIAAARRDYPETTWETGDIAHWAPATPFDVVFSNAALQWVPHHETLIPHLMTHVGPGGALAFQVPANIDAPAHRLMRVLGASPKWLPYFPRAVREWQVESASAYYDFLAPISARVDLWYTDYLHVLPNAEAIVEWYRGTGLRPWLEALPDDTTRADFLRDYLREIADAFPPQANGRVLFPFRRLFVIAYR